MPDQPGDGCRDPRRIHPHTCGECGHQQTFGAGQCRDLQTRLGVVPCCPGCGAQAWRYEIGPASAGRAEWAVRVEWPSGPEITAYPTEAEARRRYAEHASWVSDPDVDVAHPEGAATVDLLRRAVTTNADGREVPGAWTVVDTTTGKDTP